MWQRLKNFYNRQRGWNMRYGALWMIQWQFSWWISLGIHFDPKRRHVSSGTFEGWTYGPYFDIHFFFFIFSFGWHPFLSGELQNSSGAARGGVSVPVDEDLIISEVSFKWRTFVEVCLILLLLFNIYATYWRIKRGGLLP